MREHLTVCYVVRNRDICYHEHFICIIQELGELMYSVQLYKFITNFNDNSTNHIYIHDFMYA